MCHNCSNLDSLMTQLNQFTKDQIQKIFVKVNLEMTKYYSGMACELCSPRAAVGVDIETDPLIGDKNMV